MLQLRDYQRAALDSLYKYWGEGGGNGLLVIPTGGGKALVLAKLIEELLANYPDMRIVNVTHSKTLVGQNYKEFLGIMPFAPAGIYSAGLGRRDTQSQILFCGIQSVAKKTALLGAIDLVIVDEAHAISRDADSLYGKFFAGIRENNEDSRTCGLTATDYRMDSGRLTEGGDRLFDDVVYEIGIGQLIAEGYLSPLSTKQVAASIDLTGVKKNKGEFNQAQLEAAAERVMREAVAEDMIWSRDRNAALFFCSGQDNADHVRDEVRRHGRTCESLTSRTPLAEQVRIITDFVARKIWAIASANMITTGANFPFVDFISIIRSTMSPGLLVQILGRGTRLFPGKANCLVCDHGGNLRRHGPIDQISPKTPGKGEGAPPMKVCPQDAGGCGELLHISIMKCTCCGYEFPPSEEIKITARPDDAPIISTAEPDWRTVTGRTFRFHESKNPEKPPSVKTTYMCGYTAINEWHCPEHTGFPQSKAHRWWILHGGQRPFPKSVMEWLERQNELKTTAEISVVPNGKYWDVKNYRPGDEPAANDNAPAANDNDGGAINYDALRDLEEMDIPF
jgi:DNA repair protein RadD